jgi:hypothetical protein
MLALGIFLLALFVYALCAVESRIEREDEKERREDSE